MNISYGKKKQRTVKAAENMAAKKNKVKAPPIKAAEPTKETKANNK